MKYKLFATLLAVISAFAVGCSTTTNTNNANMRNANNTAVVTNTNANTYSSNTNRWNANISKEEYEKNRPEYEKNKSTTEKIGQSLEDSWLWFKTKSALMTTSNLRASTIDVDVDNGVITLQGTVADVAQKTKAVQVANGIEGKKKVVDQLKVSSSDTMTNQMVNGNKAKSNK